MGTKTVINLHDGLALALSWGVSVTPLNSRLDFDFGVQNSDIVVGDSQNSSKWFSPDLDRAKRVLNPVYLQNKKN